MEVRAQLASVFHLDKCLGCHTCSVVCKNLWTDRKGSEHMWWNNVETRPGTGYPPLWEDQQRHHGGWVLAGGELRLRLGSRPHVLDQLFQPPTLPTLDDQYEPWTYRYGDLLGADPTKDLPTARPVSAITGRPIDPSAGPNWDDDLGGSAVHAAADPNLAALDPDERQALLAFDRLVFFHLPRTCNHCLNPACAAACPSGAIYKRGEDGIVVLAKERCRGWRMCVPACPYKKTFHSWLEGKSEKCIGCYPRLESGDAPACFHACTGRIRYQGVLLYDADAAARAARAPDERLVDAFRDALLDPADPDVAAEAARAGLGEAVLAAARRSPVDRFVRDWELALPLHPEFRTLPMVFYVPPLSPVRAVRSDGARPVSDDLLADPAALRIPIRYLASLFAAGNERVVVDALQALAAVRAHRRARTAGDVTAADAARLLLEAGLDEATADAIHRLTVFPTLRERVVHPPLAREGEADRDPGIQGLVGLRRRVTS
ncbi:nitrate reductase subunit beta [Anaeromyxobacter oryzae]|uniref:Nitrate reductase subunit beta n=1 Tax=Anaeromyxobacter oryzae TaxID=2918170 RepID=A0ABM7WP78_9BACT|nr:nitrate reductase subunit beta [Anaeromyxobacter oryzae]BDG01271.1 nitrate reductase subunit beta [Anaeromyxobacter oryzae]